jgi:hypothetical protein
MRKRSSTQATSLNTPKDAVYDVAGRYKTTINRTVYLVGCVFGVLAIVSYVQFYEYLQQTKVAWPEALISRFDSLSDQAVLWAYLASWGAGAIIDLKLQRRAYVVIAERRGLERSSIVWPVLIGVSGVLTAVAWKYLDRRAFWLGLGLIGLVDYLGWRKLIVAQLKQTYQASLDKVETLRVEERLQAYIALETVRHYMVGRWKPLRYGLMAILVVVNLAYLSFPALEIGLSHLTNLPTAILRSLPFAIYVAVIEALIWYNRYRCEVGLGVVDSVLHSERIGKVLRAWRWQ